MIEPEIAFADLDDDAQLAEDFLKYIFSALLEERADDMAFFESEDDRDCISRLRSVIDFDFARIDYTEAIRVLESAPVSFEFPVSWGIDLQAEHERYLSEVHVKGPVAVVNYRKDIKAFAVRMNEDGKTVAAMDVLAPGIGEIIGGSQREERLNVLDARMNRVDWSLKSIGGTGEHENTGLCLTRASEKRLRTSHSICDRCGQY